MKILCGARRRSRDRILRPGSNLSGIHQLVRIIEQPLDIRVGDPKLVPPPKVDELKLQRLVGDMANVVFNNLRRAAKDQTDGNGLAELLAEIRAEKAAKA